jgi:hypothetical protein
MTNVDLRGIPIPDLEKMLAVWLKPAFFPQKEQTVVLLDEISSVAPSLQSVAYQFVLERRIGEHVLPKNTYPMGAGNRVIDRGICFEMAPQLKNRFGQLVVENNFEEWRPWALKNNIKDVIISYLRFRKGLGLFTYDPKSTDLAFASPRSWASASKYLDEIGEENISDHEEMLMGFIGKGVASELISFSQLRDKLPNADDIVECGKMDIEFDESIDVLHALTGALVTSARVSKDPVKAMLNLSKFCARRMPAELAVAAVGEFLLTEAGAKVKDKVWAHPSWKEYVDKYGKAIMSFIGNER